MTFTKPCSIFTFLYLLYIPITLHTHTHKVQNDQQPKRFVGKYVKRKVLSWMKVLLAHGNPFVWKHLIFFTNLSMFNILDLCGMGSQSELMLNCDNAANKMLPTKLFYNTIHASAAHTTLLVTAYWMCHKGQHYPAQNIKFPGAGWNQSSKS
jgi:hypothetical protein